MAGLCESIPAQRLHAEITALGLRHVLTVADRLREGARVKRLECLQLLHGAKGDGVTVATMRAIQDWYDVGGGPELHIDNRGCMGAAAALGLGLALAMPRRRVMVIDGDGSLCMQLGGLVSIAGEAPKNFYHVVLVNRIYETSGVQPIPAANKVDFALLAQGAGYVHAAHISDIAALEDNLGSIMSGRAGPHRPGSRRGADRAAAAGEQAAGSRRLFASSPG
jgi:hypothetical protein